MSLQKFDYTGGVTTELSGNNYIEAILREVYGPNITRLVTMGGDNKLLAAHSLGVDEGGKDSLPSEMRSFDSAYDEIGKEIKFNIETSMNGSGITQGEEGYFPEASRMEYTQAYMFITSYFATMSITDIARKIANGGKNSVENIVKREMKSLVQTARHNLVRMLHGDGVGYMALIDSVGAPSGTVRELTLDDTATFPVAPDARWLRPGMLVATYTSGTSTISSVGKVKTAGNKPGAAGAVKVDVFTGTPVAGDYILAGARALGEAATTVSSYGTDFMGYGGVFNTSSSTAFQGLTEDAVPDWAAFLYQANSGSGAIPFTDEVLNDAFSKHENWLGEELGRPMLFMTRNMINEYWASMAAERRFEPYTYKGGFKFKELMYCNGNQMVPMVQDNLIPNGEIWCPDLDHARFYWLEKPGFRPYGDNGQYLRSRHNRPITDAVYSMIGNFGTDSRRSHMRITEISADPIYT